MPSFLFRPCLAAALWGLAGGALAQAAEAAPGALTDWRQANEAVGRFERGHIDLLRWEADHLPSQAPDATETPPAWTLTDAIVSAQRSRPDLVARPGLNTLERAQLQLRQRELALKVERAWLQAVAARHRAATLRQVLQAAEAGHELGLRMARVGNWTDARQQQESLTLLDAQAQLRVAEHEARAAVLELWRVTATDVDPDPLAQKLPQALPQMLAHAMPKPGQPARTTAASSPDPASVTTQPPLPPLQELEQQALQRHPTWPLLSLEARRAAQGVAHLQALRDALHLATAPDAVTGAPQALPALRQRPRWPHAWDKALETQAKADALERRIRTDVRVAHSAWQTAQTLAQETAVETQRLVTALEADMLQRYNGMFKSTWDLLAASRARLQAEQATHQAQLGAALAMAELRAVIDGQPYTGNGPSAGSAAPAQDKGH
jgi:outer membrane protein, multidrug efflux system